LPNNMLAGGEPAYGSATSSPMGDMTEESMEEESTSSVTITKTADGAYSVSSETPGSATPEGEGGEVYRTAKEACLAAIAILDRNSDMEAEAAFAEEYSSGEPQPKAKPNKGLGIASQY